MERMPRITKDFCFVAIGLNRKSRQVIVAGFAKTRTAAMRIGRERKTNAEGPYDCYNVFSITDLTGVFLSAWLRHKGFSEDEATRLVRRIGRELMKVFPVPSGGQGCLGRGA